MRSHVSPPPLALAQSAQPRRADHRARMVLDVQADVLNHLNSTVVVPIIARENMDSEILDRLHPIIKVNNQDFILVTTDLSAVPRNILGNYVCNIRHEYDLKITDALDFLFQGF